MKERLDEMFLIFAKKFMLFALGFEGLDFVWEQAFLQWCIMVKPEGVGWRSGGEFGVGQIKQTQGIWFDYLLEFLLSFIWSI